MSWKRVCWAHSIGMEKTATDNKRVALKEKQWKNENFEPTSTPHEGSLSTTNLALLTFVRCFVFVSVSLNVFFPPSSDMSLLRALRESSRCGHFAFIFGLHEAWRGSGREHEREKFELFIFIEIPSLLHIPEHRVSSLTFSVCLSFVGRVREGGKKLKPLRSVRSKPRSEGDERFIIYRCYLW